MNFDAIGGPFTLLEFPPFDAIYRTNTDTSRLHPLCPDAPPQLQPLFLHQEPLETIGAIVFAPFKGTPIEVISEYNKFWFQTPVLIDAYHQLCKKFASPFVLPTWDIQNAANIIAATVSDEKNFWNGMEYGPPQ